MAIAWAIIATVFWLCVFFVGLGLFIGFIKLLVHAAWAPERHRLEKIRLRALENERRTQAEIYRQQTDPHRFNKSPAAIRWTGPEGWENSSGHDDMCNCVTCRSERAEAYRGAVRCFD